MSDIITVNDLNLWYGPTQALHHVTISVPEHSITALIGPSGCGKSTFLKTLDRMNDLIPGVKVALTDCAVAGGADGWTVAATQTDTAVVQDYGAGGFAAYCNSAELSGCHVSGLVSVTASEDQGFAGGFVGISRTGGSGQRGWKPSSWRQPDLR